MGLIVAHINKQAATQEANAKALWENVLRPKWEAKDRAEADKLFSKIKPGEILVDMIGKQGA